MHHKPFWGYPMTWPILNANHDSRVRWNNSLVDQVAGSRESPGLTTRHQGTCGSVRWSFQMCARDWAGLSEEDVYVSLSDHEPAVRAGLRTLGMPGIGCGCHAIQLSVKHSLPALRQKRPQMASDSESDSGSSTSSSSTSSSHGEKEAGPAQPAQARPGRKADPAAQACKEALKEPFKRYCSMLREIVHNPCHSFR